MEGIDIAPRHDARWSRKDDFIVPNSEEGVGNDGVHHVAWIVAMPVNAERVAELVGRDRLKSGGVVIFFDDLDLDFFQDIPDAGHRRAPADSGKSGGEGVGGESDGQVGLCFRRDDLAADDAPRGPRPLIEAGQRQLPAFPRGEAARREEDAQRKVFPVQQRPHTRRVRVGRTRRRVLRAALGSKQRQR